MDIVQRDKVENKGQEWDEVVKQRGTKKEKK